MRAGSERLTEVIGLARDLGDNRGLVESVLELLHRDGGIGRRNGLDLFKEPVGRLGAGWRLIMARVEAAKMLVPL